MLYEPYYCYCVYLALQRHFYTDSYDAFKYNFKVNASRNAFEKRKDRYFFTKIAKSYGDSRESLIEFYVANFKSGVKWAGDMINSDMLKPHQSIIQSIGYSFEQDILKLSQTEESFNTLLSSEGGDIPDIIKAYLRGDINIETVAILHRITGFMEGQDKHCEDVLVWPEVKRLVVKYSPFLQFDRKKAVHMVKQNFI